MYFVSTEISRGAKSYHNSKFSRVCIRSDAICVMSARVLTITYYYCCLIFINKMYAVYIVLQHRAQGLMA